MESNKCKPFFIFTQYTKNILGWLEDEMRQFVKTLKTGILETLENGSTIFPDIIQALYI